MDKDLIIKKLEEENEDLKTKLTDLLFEHNYSKEIELAELVRDLYQSLSTVDSKVSKEDIVKNLKEYIEEFSRNNKFML